MKSVVIFGAGRISLEVAKNVLENGWQCIIISNEDQFKKNINGTSIFDVTKKMGVDIFKAEAESELIALQLNVLYDNAVYLSIGAPYIFKKQTLDYYHNKLINLHGSLLPKDRGGTLFSWQILKGQRTGMCLLHQITKGIDDGPIMAYEEFIYPASCRLPIHYIEEYENRNIQFIIKYLYSNQIIKYPIHQPEYLSTYWPRLRADVHGWIDWSWNYQDIERLICAFDQPYGGARCRFQNKIIIIRDVWSQSCDGKTHPFQQGLIYRNNGKWVNVAANGGELLICTIRDENGNDIIGQIKPGDRFYTEPDDLLLTKQRVVKSKNGLIKQQLNK